MAHWYPRELEAAVKAYIAIRDQPSAKVRVIFALRKKELSRHNANSVHRRMQNISFVLKKLGQEWIKTYTPAAHVGSGVKKRLQEFLEQAFATEAAKQTEGGAGSGDPTEKISVESAAIRDGPEELVFLEGEMRAGKSRVRNVELREAAKRKWGLNCYCCGFEYEAFYGSIAKGLAIVHHLQLFRSLNEKARKATVKDVRVVCANCHHVLHVEDPPIDVDVLKKLIADLQHRRKRK